MSDQQWDDRAVTRRTLLRALAAAGVAAPLGGALRLSVPRTEAAPALAVIDPKLGLFLAQMSALTYDQYANGGRVAPPAGYRLVLGFKATAFGSTEWFGFVVESADRIVVAFRGSRSDPDWIADGDIANAAYPFVAGAGLTHAGWTSIYGTCRAGVLRAVRGLAPSKQMFVTGHSLGAALATLCALDLAVNTPFRGLTMYNYASPRVGDAAFASACNARIGASVRVVNVHDIVPMMPGADYVHVRAEYPFSTQTRTIAGNHAMTTYLAAMQALNK